MPAQRFGDPIPLSRREPLLKQLAFEVDAHYGLVGAGPTQFTDDIRFGLFDWWELRTSLAPYPASLMSRFKIGSHNSALGAFVLDGGLANFDAGFRLVPQAGEPPVGLRGTFEVGAAYSRAIDSAFALYLSARWRYRLSALSNDAQNAIGADGHLTWDIMKNFSAAAGIGYSRIVAGEVRELAINFVEPGQPGLSHFLIRIDGVKQSLTLPLSVTYGLIDSFDVDVFATPRLFPQLDVLFGAGIRWRVLDWTRPD